MNEKDKELSTQHSSLGAHTPVIRFKGFSGEWEEKKLGENADFSKGQGYSKSDLVAEGSPIILYGRLYTKYQTAISKVDTFAIETNKSILSNGNEVLVPASGETAEDISRASAVMQSGIVLGGDLNIIYPSNKLDSLFLALAISNGKPQKDLSKRAQGKSVVHVRNNDLKEIDISYPDISEQTKIGNYFQQLDTLIAQHQQKHDKLLNLKKSLLEKMFPKQYADVPEIRFKEFSMEWDEKTLGNVADIVGGGTPSTLIPEYWNGNIHWYSPTEIGKSVFVNKSEKRITKIGLEKSSAKILPANKTVLFTSRAGIGDMAILSKESCTNQGFQSFIVNDDNNTYFLYTSGHLIKEYALKHASGSTFLEISGKQLCNMTIKMPLLKEQTKIGNLFKQLDTLLNQHQAQLKKLNNIKQACLAKMFV